MSEPAKQEESASKSPMGPLFGEDRAGVLLTLFIMGADLVHFGYFHELNGYFREIISEPSKNAVLMTLGLFTLYVVSLFFVCRLKTTGRAWPKGLMVAPSIGFGLLMMMAAVNVSGMGDTEQSAVPESWQMFATFGALSILVALGVVQLVNFKQRYDQKSPQYYVLFVLLVIASELILNFAYALWMYYFGPDFGAPPIEDPDIFWSLVFGVPFFFFFAAPRFMLMPLNFTLMALASAIFVAFYELWKFLTTWPII